MKLFLIISACIAATLAEAPASPGYPESSGGPYPPSGWKPSGPLLALPARQQQAYGPPAPQPPAEYGPPQEYGLPTTTTTTTTPDAEPTETTPDQPEIPQKVKANKHHLIIKSGIGPIYELGNSQDRPHMLYEQWYSLCGGYCAICESKAATITMRSASLGTCLYRELRF